MKKDHGRLVVIGASAGGVAAVLALAEALPPRFAAPVCVVLHIGTHASILPELLANRGPNAAVHASEGDKLEAGMIYVAPPDRHLLVVGDTLHLSHAAKENHTRPAIDPLFRTAAVAWRERTIGVVLSGQLDDGAAGLRAIRECGGMALVQDPASALEREMPLNALAVNPDARALPPALLAAELQRLLSLPPPPAGDPPAERLVRETAIHLGDFSMDNIEAIGDTTSMTCPECGGSLWRIREEQPDRFRCHTGHSFTALALDAAQVEASEQALWSALRALREREMLLRRVAKLSQATGDAHRAAVGLAKADGVRAQVEALKLILERGRGGQPSMDASA